MGQVKVKKRLSRSGTERSQGEMAAIRSNIAYSKESLIRQAVPYGGGQALITRLYYVQD
jgi:hypothetical protein